MHIHIFLILDTILSVFQAVTGSGLGYSWESVGVLKLRQSAFAIGLFLLNYAIKVVFFSSHDNVYRAPCFSERQRLHSYVT